MIHISPSLFIRWSQEWDFASKFMRAFSTLSAEVFWLCVNWVEVLIVTHACGDRWIDFAIATATHGHWAHVPETCRSQVALQANWGDGSHGLWHLCSGVPRKLNGSLVNRWEMESLALEDDWSVEILSFCSWAIKVVFACHHLEILMIMLLDALCHKPLLRFGVNWLSSVPVISKESLIWC